MNRHFLQEASFRQRKLFASHAQGVGYAVDVVEPGGDERDLQDCLVVESGGAQPVVIVFPDFGGVLGEFDYVIQHHAFWLGYGCAFIVLLQGFHERFV
jgi:hypothetical protein